MHGHTEVTSGAPAPRLRCTPADQGINFLPWLSDTLSCGGSNQPQYIRKSVYTDGMATYVDIDLHQWRAAAKIRGPRDRPVTAHKSVLDLSDTGFKAMMHACFQVIRCHRFEARSCHRRVADASDVSHTTAPDLSLAEIRRTC